jgi:phosphoenolpyruvate carboxykinase (ATP)
MRNMLIRPTAAELEHFHPDYVIYNAGAFPANRYTTGMTSSTSIALNFHEKEMVILGTEYAGEMKKGKWFFLLRQLNVLLVLTNDQVSSPFSSTKCPSSTTS